MHRDLTADRLNDYGKKLATFTKVSAAFLLLALVSGNAFAQRVTSCNTATPNNALCLTWLAPTTHTDGTPIVNAITYRVQRHFNGGSFANVATGLTDRFLYQTNLAPGLYTYRVYATVSSAESAASPEASRTATATTPPIPNPPVITIAVLISPDAPPTVVKVNGEDVYASVRP